MSQKAVIFWGAILLSGCASVPVKRPPFVAYTLSFGVSMQPAFDVAEEVSVELCRFTDLRTNDTVIFWYAEAGSYAHHRLSHRCLTTGRWITKGDGNRHYDAGRMTADEFVGRTHKWVKGFGVTPSITQE